MIRTRVSKKIKNYRPPQSLRVGAEVGDYTAIMWRAELDTFYIEQSRTALCEDELEVAERRKLLEKGELVHW